jgi:hypothetical protein
VQFDDVGAWLLWRWCGQQFTQAAGIVHVSMSLIKAPAGQPNPQHQIKISQAHPQRISHFSAGGLPAQLLGELGSNPAQPGQLGAMGGRQSDGSAAAVGPARQALADPPVREGGELVPAGRIKPLSATHQADGAGLEQVGHVAVGHGNAQPRPHHPGDMCDQAEIPRDEPIPGPQAPPLDGWRGVCWSWVPVLPSAHQGTQVDFLGSGEKGLAATAIKPELDGVGCHG